MWLQQLRQWLNLPQYKELPAMTPGEAPWLIVGLGNPGPKYDQTRHNIGFEVIDALASQWHTTLSEQKKFKGWAAKTTTQGLPVVLLKPTTYMNLSGESVQPLMKFYQIPVEQLLVIYDDLALPVGKLRIRPNGSSGGHNGMNSIIQTLGGRQDFTRLRLGVGPKPPQWDQKDFVLAPFRTDEKPSMAKVIDGAVDATTTIISQGVETAMNRYNSENWSA